MSKWKRIIVISIYYIVVLLLVTYIPFYHYFIPKLAIYKSEAPSNLFTSCLYKKSEIYYDKRGYFVSINGKDFFTNDIILIGFKNNFPYSNKRGAIRNFETNKCYLIQYVSVLKIQLLGYEKIFIYDYIQN